MFYYCRQKLALDANVYHHEYFNTNSIESLNNAIKVWQEYRREDMAKFIVSIRQFIECQQKEARKPFLKKSSNLMVNPVYEKYVKEGYWTAAESSRRDFLKVVPEFPLENISYESTHPINPPAPVAPETVDDIDLLVGYMTGDFVENMKDKVRRLREEVRPGFEGKESRLKALFF